MGKVPEDAQPEDEDVLLDYPDTVADDDAASPAVPSRSARGSRSERRRAASARRGAGARNRAAVFTENLPAELKKPGVMVAGTVVILVVLTVLLR